MPGLCGGVPGSAGHHGLSGQDGARGPARQAGPPARPRGKPDRRPGPLLSPVSATARGTSGPRGRPDPAGRRRYRDHVPSSAVRDAIVRYRANPGLTREHAAARVSAYVYGNILIFAAVLALDATDVRYGRAILVELGVAFSTFLAHVLSEVIGHGIRTNTPTTKADVLHEIRDSTPIVTSALIPCLLLTTAVLAWLPGPVAITASELYLFTRLAVVGFVIDRFRSRRTSSRTLLAGALIALIAAGIAVLKVALSY